MKKTIAISSRIMKHDDYTYDYVNKDYIKILTHFNIEPYVVLSVHDMQKVAQMCDGLILCGGIDVDPKYYGQKPHPTVTGLNNEIDESDLKMIDAFVKADKPILGICRGLQILNTYFKGTLIQDIPSTYPDLSEIHSQKTDRQLASHKIIIEPDSLLESIFGNEAMVNSFHHQSIDVPAKGFKVTARSEEGIIEAIEKDKIIAVQWHPEGMSNDKLQLKLIETFIKML